jgi:hypothetical protein
LSTFSEVFQEKFGRKDCPFIFDCDIEITKDFFSRVCKTLAYTNCNHFAKRVGELKVPMSWLQKLAIDQARVMDATDPDIETAEQTPR